MAQLASAEDFIKMVYTLQQEGIPVVPEDKVLLIFTTYNSVGLQPQTIGIVLDKPASAEPSGGMDASFD